MLRKCIYISIYGGSTPATAEGPSLLRQQHPRIFEVHASRAITSTAYPIFFDPHCPLPVSSHAGRLCTSHNFLRIVNVDSRGLRSGQVSPLPAGSMHTKRAKPEDQGKDHHGKSGKFSNPDTWGEDLKTTNKLVTAGRVSKQPTRLDDPGAHPRGPYVAVARARASLRVQNPFVTSLCRMLPVNGSCAFHEANRGGHAPTWGSSRQTRPCDATSRACYTLDRSPRRLTRPPPSSLQILHFMAGSWITRPGMPSKKEIERLFPVAKREFETIRNPPRSDCSFSLAFSVVSCAHQTRCEPHVLCQLGWSSLKEQPAISHVSSRRNAVTTTWIGHASFLVQMGEVNILTDPIFSSRAEPLPYMGPWR